MFFGVEMSLGLLCEIINTKFEFPEDDLVSRIPVVDMVHEPLGFVRVEFKTYQLNWAVVDKEACAILSVCRRLSYLL